jgi:hypothetical protein
MRVGTKLPAYALLMSIALVGCTTGQRHFDTPEQAVEVLLSTLRADDVDGMAKIFGSEHREVYATADVAADVEARQIFLREADERLTLDQVDADTVEIIVGEQDWPLPVPLVREDAGWRFDTAAGAEELIDRRVGRNEIWAIELCEALVAAQDYYRENDLDGDGTMSFARKLKATPGQCDGLYWPEEEGKPLSYLDGREKGSPWRGYYARMISRQGAGAPGGAMEFVEDGEARGYALIMWPAEYGSTGVMTFITSHLGTVYEKDFGDETAEAVAAIDVFDPDDSWQIVE